MVYTVAYNLAYVQCVAYKITVTYAFDTMSPSNTHTHTHGHTHTHTCAHTRTHTHTHMRTHTHTHTDTCTYKHADYTKLNLHSLKQVPANRDLRQKKLKLKTWHVYSFGKRNVFRLHLNESREGFYQRWKGGSFHAEGPKTGKAQEPPVESLVQGIWRL